MEVARLSLYVIIVFCALNLPKADTTLYMYYIQYIYLHLYIYLFLIKKN